MAALKAIERKYGLGIYNMGTGHGYSVLDMVNAFIKVNGVNVPYGIKPRRAGDIATCYCNQQSLKQNSDGSKFGIEEMVRDSWNWQKNNQGLSGRKIIIVYMDYRKLLKDILLNNLGAAWFWHCLYRALHFF